MEPTKRTLTFNILRKVLILAVLCLGYGVLFLTDNAAEASGSACYDTYVACHAACNDPNQHTQPAPSCHSGCMGPYGNCVNQAQLDKQGQILSGYEEGQPMPVLQDFLICIQNCGTCLITDYVDDPEGMQVCTETWLACKITCIESF